MSPRKVTGRQIEANWVARTLEEKLDDPFVLRCAWCDWTKKATLRTRAELHQKHLETKHKDRKVKRVHTKRQRTLAFGQLSTKQIAENIAHVRSQGGHTFKQDPYEHEDAA